MPFVFHRKFTPPQHLSTLEQLKYTVGILEKHRQEAKVLRHDTAWAKLAQNKLQKQAIIWKKKYQEEKRKNGILRKENNGLKQEIEKLTKTNSRYQVSLFDHGNFKSSDSREKKPKGGQLNHTDTNREGQVRFPGYENFPRKRIYAKNCGHCGNSLSRVDATKQKLLLDIVVKPEIIQMIIESERQWCGKCKKEVIAKGEQTLPFTEYGLNTFMMVMILRFQAHCSFSTIPKVIGAGFGLTLSRSDISNMLKVAAKYLGKKYEELKTAVRNGEVIYADETGWLVKGQTAWMWIMAAEDTTVYVAAESRGKGVAEDIYGSSQSYCMTDGLKSYLKIIPPHKHCYCWAHMLRFSFEETIHCKKTSDAVSLRDNLVRIYHLKRDFPQYSKHQLKQVLESELNNLLKLTSGEGSFKNIQGRLKGQKQGLILSLLKTSDGTNNLAERELRTMVLNRKVSNGSNTYTGMQTSAVLGSIIQTFSRQKQNLLTELTLHLQIGIHQKYHQYQHLAYLDTS
ncbi:IS66 family transposase [Candidatus Daviesbacteria bacterium]|nr:IS66 family transposase [Candidatus Daviesbacteria bacterium]